jgi:hypothetical protein
MSRVAELIDLIVQGKNAEATDVLNSELMGRSYSAINDMKPEVAMNYFAPVVNMDAEGNVSSEEPQQDYEIGDAETEPTEEQ